MQKNSIFVTMFICRCLNAILSRFTDEIKTGFGGGGRWMNLRQHTVHKVISEVVL